MTLSLMLIHEIRQCMLVDISRNRFVEHDNSKNAYLYLLPAKLCSPSSRFTWNHFFQKYFIYGNQTDIYFLMLQSKD